MKCPKALEKYLNRFSLYVVSYRFPIELVIGGKDIQKAYLCQIFSEENESKNPVIYDLPPDFCSLISPNSLKNNKSYSLVNYLWVTYRIFAL